MPKHVEFDNCHVLYFMIYILRSEFVGWYIQLYCYERGSKFSEDWTPPEFFIMSNPIKLPYLIQAKEFLIWQDIVKY